GFVLSHRLEAVDDDLAALHLLCRCQLVEVRIKDVLAQDADHEFFLLGRDGPAWPLHVESEVVEIGGLDLILAVDDLNLSSARRCLCREQERSGENQLYAPPSGHTFSGGRATFRTEESSMLAPGANRARPRAITLKMPKLFIIAGRPLPCQRPEVLS